MTLPGAPQPLPPLRDPVSAPVPRPEPGPPPRPLRGPAPDPDVPPMPPDAGSRTRHRGRTIEQPPMIRPGRGVRGTPETVGTTAAGRWVRAVDGELVNLNGCDYVAVEQESQ